ncbi:MAG TPA: hypothetical protein VJ260_08810 [Vicinamibacterales bacterium]|jgi:hypothetical protein|nr:hypothetical protein [Vicinamibacterales bacterium]
MLLALAKKLLAQAKQADYGNLPIGTLTFAEPYPQLRYGDVDGIGTVTIDQTGNMIGMSPVERCSANGETAWIPLELVHNIRMEPAGFVGTTRGKTGRAAKNETK